eukprot:2147525-Pyramimonas_sp.AAC.1
MHRRCGAILRPHLLRSHLGGLEEDQMSAKVTTHSPVTPSWTEWLVSLKVLQGAAICDADGWTK